MKLTHALEYASILGMGTAAYFAGDFAAPYIAELSSEIGPTTAKVSAIGALEALVAIYAGKVMNKQYAAPEEKKKDFEPGITDEDALTIRERMFGGHPFGGYF